MQTDNMQLLQEKNYHLFNGGAAIYLEKAKYIRFDHLFYNIPTFKVGKNKKEKLKNFFKMGRYMMILGYKIMLCNPHYTEKQLFDCLYHIFVEFCPIPKTKNLVQHVKKLGNNISLIEGNIKFTEENRRRIEIGAEKVINKPYRGWIKKQPKVIFNPDYELTEEEKREISNKIVGSRKSSKTLEKVYLTLLNWDAEEKPTQKNIAKKLNKSERTIKNYWKPAKEKLNMAI